MRSLAIALLLQSGCALWAHGDWHLETGCVNAWPGAVDTIVGGAGAVGVVTWHEAFGSSLAYIAIPTALFVEGAYYAIEDARCRARARTPAAKPDERPLPFDWSAYAPCAIDHPACDAGHTCRLVDAAQARCMPD